MDLFDVFILGSSFFFFFCFLKNYILDKDKKVKRLEVI